MISHPQLGVRNDKAILSSRRLGEIYNDWEWQKPVQHGNRYYRFLTLEDSGFKMTRRNVVISTLRRDL
jgi:hypothetical protein